MSEQSSTSSSIVDFKSAVHEWLALQNATNEMQRQIREKKKRMSKLDFFISRYMKDHEKEFCKINDTDTLVLKRKKTTSGLNKNLILQFMNELLQDEARAEEYTKRLYDMRTKKETDYVSYMRT